MATPNDCRECGCTTCTAWHYGGRCCKYAAEIAARNIDPVHE